LTQDTSMKIMLTKLEAGSCQKTQNACTKSSLQTAEFGNSKLGTVGPSGSQFFLGFFEYLVQLLTDGLV
jgi:hypothetical protein